MFKKIILLLIFFFILRPSFGHGEDLVRLSVHAPYSYDLKNNKSSYGVDINFTALFLNAGINYKNSNNVIKNNVLDGFLGIGFYNIIQLQFGYSTNYYGLIRLRTEWRLSDFGFIFNKKLDFLENFSIKANLDRSLFNDEYDWFYSVGIGYSFNIF